MKIQQANPMVVSVTSKKVCAQPKRVSGQRRYGAKVARASRRVSFYWKAANAGSCLKLKAKTQSTGSPRQRGEVLVLLGDWEEFYPLRCRNPAGLVFWPVRNRRHLHDAQITRIRERRVQGLDRYDRPCRRPNAASERRSDAAVR